MKIRTNTPELLIVEDRPWLLGVMLGGFILLFVAIGLSMLSSGEMAGWFVLLFGGGMGVVAFMAFVRRVQAVFHRSEGWVEIRRANVLRRQTVRHELHEVSRAVVQELSGKDGPTRRVALIFDDGPSAGTHPLRLAYTNYGNPQGVADAINAWLR